eukprot:5913391-Amphidinium_carterae.1
MFGSGAPASNVDHTQVEMAIVARENPVPAGGWRRLGCPGTWAGARRPSNESAAPDSVTLRFCGPRAGASPPSFPYRSFAWWSSCALGPIR